MRDLFVMDQKDYDPEGTVFSRPSVRAVIERDGKVLLIYSKLYDYYKFPGGGPKKGETHAEALFREVREESGYWILPETMEEFGRVLRRQKDSEGTCEIFEQENFYYFCDAEEEPGDVELDDYEKEEGFTAVWMEPFMASRHNRYLECPQGDPVMIRRESKVLDLVDMALRDRIRKRKEKKTIASLGELDYADMLAFVEETLGDTGTEYSGSGKVEIAYSRFEHTKRVLGWAKRLYDAAENKDELRYEDVMIATIFHDVGRKDAPALNLPHAKAGVPITKEYLLAHGFDAERTEYICSLVGQHSDKYRMQDPEIDKNLLLLMEADDLDDMGALGVVMDCMIVKGRNPMAHFTDCLDHITRYTYRQQQKNPMVTAAARAYWDEKTQLVNAFVAALRSDVEL